MANRRQTPRVRSKKTRMFIHQVHHPEVKTVRVREGTIIYLQVNDSATGYHYGLIVGFVASQWREVRGTKVVTVNPLTTAGEKKYTAKFAKLLDGHLTFCR